MRRFELMLLFVVIFGLLLIILLFFKKENNKCDRTVVLNDGTEIPCKSIFTARSGLTFLRTCDDKEMELPLSSIKVIKHHE